MPSRIFCPGLRTQIPQSINLEVFFDRTQSIRESVHDVQLTMIGTIVLVILVIFLFLRNVSATIIPSLALPMSIVGTFAVMYLLDYSLDNLSLMALTLAVGFVVDDAIVVLENIVRHMENGEKPYDAAVKGAQEIGFTIVSMTLRSGCRIYSGAVYERHAGPDSARICRHHLRRDPGFGFISLSLTPMLASRYLRPPHDQKHGWLYNFLGRCLDAMNKAYEATLTWVMRHHVYDDGGLGTGLVATAYMFTLGAQRIYSERRYRPSLDQHRGRARRVLRADGAVPAALGSDRRQGSQRRSVLFERRRRRRRLDRQYRPNFYQAQIALRTTGGVFCVFVDKILSDLSAPTS